MAVQGSQPDAPGALFEGYGASSGVQQKQLG